MNKLIEQIHQAAQGQIDDTNIKRAAEYAQLKTARAIGRLFPANQM